MALASSNRQVMRAKTSNGVNYRLFGKPGCLRTLSYFHRPVCHGTTDL